MMVGVVVEGKSEATIAPIILNWLGIRFRPAITTAEGVDDLIQRARELADWQLSKGATHILFFLDADGGERADRIAQLQQSLARAPSPPPLAARQEGTFFFVPVPELEAWLLADEAALGVVLGRKVERQARLEEAGSVGRLHELFHQMGGYRKTYHPKLIAQNASDRAWRRCVSYEGSTAALRPSVP